MPAILSQLDPGEGLYGRTARPVSDLQITQSICVVVKGSCKVPAHGWSGRMRAAQHEAGPADADPALVVLIQPVDVGDQRCKEGGRANPRPGPYIHTHEP